MPQGPGATSRNGQVRRARRVPLRALPAATDTLERAPLAGTGNVRLSGAIAWGALGTLVISFSVALTGISPAFDTANAMIDRPVLLLVSLLVSAGAVFALCLPLLFRATQKSNAGTLRMGPLLFWIVGCGLIARLVLFPSVPILEDDYQRYLWDGAVTANGLNPYSVSPKAARDSDPNSQLGQLATKSGHIVRRVNHPNLKTIYPPVAQGAFAAAHMMAPWSLTSWRAVILLCDVVVLSLILLLLNEAGRPLIWSALYWWNPLVLKELFNSAHMEAIVLVFVLLALLLMAVKQPIGAIASLALAAGAKIWPVLLAPLILRPIIKDPRRLAIALIVFCGLLAALAAPMLLAGLDSGSGLTAYASRWQTNSALFPMIEQLIGTGLAWLKLPDVDPGVAARAILAIGLGALAIFVCRKPLQTTNDLIGRASLVVGALVLVAPAQFPWYAIWFAPFLVFRPWTGFLALNATIPLYYLFFYLAAHAHVDVFETVIVWIIWIPVWIGLAFDALRHQVPRQSG